MSAEGDALRRAARKMRTERIARDREIHRLHREGWSLREIALLAQMTHAGVARVLQRDES